MGFSKSLPELTKGDLFYPMLLMKLGIFAAFLFWVGVSVGWAQELTGDLDLWPPTTKMNRKEVMERFGKIEFNFGPDGSVKGKDSMILETDEAIKNYILKSKDEFIAAGKEPILHLQGVTDPKFGTVRRLIAIASDIGINRMITSLELGGVLEVEAPVVPKEKSEPSKEADDVIESRLKSLVEHSIKPRKEDLGLAVPGNNPVKNAKEVLIHLDAQGQVFIGKEKTPLDKDADKREMLLLRAELEKLQAGGEQLAVIVHVEPATVKQRVIDLLNTLAAVGISSVAFSDLIEDD